MNSISMKNTPAQIAGVEQKIGMSVRTMTSLRTLQQSVLELQADVREALAMNPFLEEVEAATDGESDLEEEGGPTDAISDPDVVPGNETAPPEDYIEWGAGAQSETSLDVSAFDVACNLPATPSLLEVVTRGLFDLGLDERGHCLAELIAGGLDEDGYLRENLNELRDLLDPSLGVSLEEMQSALKHVQDAVMPGIGARNLTECLELQLLALPEPTPARALALRVVQEQLSSLAGHHFFQMAAGLGCSRDELAHACELIARLDPKPGHAFGAVETGYVVPDVVVYRKGHRWHVRANNSAAPRARLNPLYTRLYALAGGAHESPAMAEQLREARWKLRDIQNRNSTILRVAEYLVEKQQAFFTYGDSALRAISLKDVADTLGVNPSTISRATSNKYMQTSRGTISFKCLFSRDLVTTTGGRCSTASAKAAVAAIIAAETEASAMTDRAITHALASEGIRIARRTVTKYRQQLGKLPANVRRERADG